MLYAALKVFFRYNTFSHSISVFGILRSTRTIVLAGRASGRHLDTQTLKDPPSGYPKFSVIDILRCQF